MPLLSFDDFAWSDLVQSITRAAGTLQRKIGDG